MLTVSFLEQNDTDAGEYENLEVAEKCGKSGTDQFDGTMPAEKIEGKEQSADYPQENMRFQCRELFPCPADD